MKNPFLTWRESAGITRDQLCVIADVSTWTALYTETGKAKELSPIWRETIESFGGSYDDLARGYLEWRKAERDRLLQGR